MVTTKYLLLLYYIPSFRALTLIFWNLRNFENFKSENLLSEKCLSVIFWLIGLKIQMAAMGTILVRGTIYFGYKLVIIPSFSYDNLVWAKSTLSGQSRGGGLNHSPNFQNGNSQTLPFIGLSK